MLLHGANDLFGFLEALCPQQVGEACELEGSAGPAPSVRALV
jgi:hypothetical protein